MDPVILGTVMCLHRVTNHETDGHAVQLIIETDDNNIDIVVSLEIAKQFSIGTKVSLTLEVIGDATH